MSLTLNSDFIEQNNYLLRSAGCSDIIAWTLENFEGDVALTTSFGYSGIVLLHHILKIAPALDIYFINTGYHFSETLDLASQIADQWKLNIHIIEPEISKQKQREIIGGEPYTNHELCCEFNKIKPYKTFIYNKNVWLSALRRDQSDTRNEINILQFDSYGRLKIHPLCYYTSQQIWQYIRVNKLPYNKLHDSNYLSIGCKHCTIPIHHEMHERDGRWPFSAKKECGLNSFSNKI